MIDGVDLSAVISVFFHVRTDQTEVRTFLLCLPDGLGGDYALFLGQLIFGQDYAVTVVGVAADCHGHVAKLRMSQQLHGSVKPVHVAVEYDPVILFLSHVFRTSFPDFEYNTEWQKEANICVFCEVIIGFLDLKAIHKL